MNKIKSWYIYAGVAALGVVAFVMTEPEKTPVRERKAAETRSTSRTTKEEAFTQEDFEAKFSRVAAAPKNGFNPLVLSGKSASVRGGRLAPNEIPTTFTGGNERWIYTGTAVVDGVPQALVENVQSGEGEFLSVGQDWKNSVVRRITPTSLVLEGPNLMAMTFELMEDPVDDEGNYINSSLQPVAPPAPPQGGQPAQAGAQPGANGQTRQNVGGGRRRGFDPSMFGQIGGSNNPAADASLSSENPDDNNLRSSIPDTTITGALPGDN
jgi:hypothetical protein